MSSCKVGNQTNSQDPQAVNSRVFVGNLNTFQCSKTDVERRFQRYGRIAGISMHKGYAFIQFTNPFDARSACLGENGRLLWGQTLDANMVAEPKAHQTGRKRQNIAKTGNDWDYYYDSYYAQMGLQTPRLMPPMKRPRIHVPPPYVAATAAPNMVNPAVFHNNNTIQQQLQQQQQQQQRRNSYNHKGNCSSNNNNNNNNNGIHKSQSPNHVSISELKTYSTPDILICGNCRELFSEVEQLMQHKQNYCKLRFTCKCHMLNGCNPKTPGEEPASLLCSQCKDSFQSAWDLMVHVQTAHLINIYQLGGDSNGGVGDHEIDPVAEHGSPASASLLAILGTGGGGSNPGEVETSPFDIMAMTADDEHHKCHTSCQTSAGSNTPTFSESNNNSISSSIAAAGGSELIVHQPMSSNCSTSSCSSSSMTVDGLLDPVANFGGSTSSSGSDEEARTLPQQSPKTTTLNVNGGLNFSKEMSTSTQSLGCQTDQQQMMTMNNINNNNNNGFDDVQDCGSSTRNMLTSVIKVEDGPCVAQFVAGTV